MSLSYSETDARFLVCLLVLTSFLISPAASLSGADFQGSTHLLDFDFEPIRYATSESSTAIDAVNRKLARGQESFAFTEKQGYLNSVLSALDISPSSQVLVYAKSSAQRDFIGPNNPRAIYFNDDVYVGYIPGAPVLELTASDPRLGTIFYTLDH